MLTCFVCEASVIELTHSGMGTLTVNCIGCGIYRITGAAIAAIGALTPEERVKVLEKARATAAKGDAPEISKILF
jgi:hypothetical protein